MTETQVASINPSMATRHIKSFWLYVTVGTLAFMVGAFVVWQVYNSNLDEEIQASAVIKTRIIEKTPPVKIPAGQPTRKK